MAARNEEDIVQYSNNRNMLIASDYLKVTNYLYGSIHAEKENDGNGKNRYSRIRFTMIEHQKKSKQFCNFNLTVDDCRWIFHVSDSNVLNWEFLKEKVIGENVNKLTIKRQAVDQNGNPRFLPWYIEISNGSAVPEVNGNLTTYKRGTYEEKTKLGINMSDENFYTFMYRIIRFIEIFENGYANYIVQKKFEFESSWNQQNV